MTTLSARSNPISQRVMKPLEVGVFTAEESPGPHLYQGTGNGYHWGSKCSHFEVAIRVAIRGSSRSWARVALG